MATVVQVSGITSALSNATGGYILLDNTGNPITGANGVLVVKITNQSTGNIATTTWTGTDVTYQYTNISATGGTGDNATFDVTVLTSAGQGIYQATINNPGTNYQIDDVLTIPGDSLGGDTPLYDLTITVTNVDIDGLILEFTYTGQSVWPQSINGSTTILPKTTEYVQVTPGIQPGGVFFTNSVSDGSLLYITPVSIVI